VSPNTENDDIDDAVLNSTAQRIFDILDELDPIHAQMCVDYCAMGLACQNGLTWTQWSKPMRKFFAELQRSFAEWKKTQPPTETLN